MVPPGLFSRVIRFLLRQDQESKRSIEGTERKAYIGAYVTGGFLIGAAAGVCAVELVPAALGLLALAALPLLGTQCGRVMGERGWQGRLRQLEASPDVVNRRELVRDKYLARLQDINQLASGSPGMPPKELPKELTRRKLEAYDWLTSQLDALERGPQGQLANSSLDANGRVGNRMLPPARGDDADDSKASRDDDIREDLDDVRPARARQR